MAGQRGFQLVEDDPLASPPTPGHPAEHGAALSVLLLSLRALGQRALVALADLFTLATVASAWWLWHTTPDPNTFQLTGLGMYALFILAANYIVRRR